MKTLFFCTLLAACAPLAVAQKRPAITGVAFVRFYTADATASDEFYAKTLGYSSSKAGDITRYPVNDLQWIEVAPLPSPAPVSRQAAVGFMTRDARSLERYLKAHHIAIVDELHDGRFSVLDPEGNLIVFVQQVKQAAVPPPVPATAVSRRMIHAGFVVQDQAKENAFYRELLGFRPYWHGGRDDTSTDYVAQQVPDGSDWLEYMLNNGPHPCAQTARLQRPHLPRRRAYGRRHRRARAQRLHRHQLHRQPPWPRWQGPAQPLRSRPDPHRVHGVHSLGQDLLLRVHCIASHCHRDPLT
ncbi:MAG: hypothetical protein PW789_18655 [Edaphobacter sp.]|uniref:VOC family protein n=1 Tax=Edaphobacter sp. TaxID=1934404 RepID=UPI00238A16C6|nr:VOC family protein [Edaphobacter sp.]MDE1178600.1 hypothetical protein [Edaphobacter sp.]